MGNQQPDPNNCTPAQSDKQITIDAGSAGFMGGLTTRKYMGMTKTSRATSYREITELLNKKMLVQNPGKGRCVSYDLAWPVSFVDCSVL